MKEKLLEVQNLTVHYRDEKDIIRAVNGVDFHINKGEVFGLVGETGAGKTTTALSIMRLLPKYNAIIPSGSILFDGQDLLQASESKMREIRGADISMIFQDPMTSLNPVYPVGEQISEVLRLHNTDWSKKTVEKRVSEILLSVGIAPERRNEYPHQFSGGMKQRVMIAIAIACQPRILIADEPTTALDVTIQAQVISLMRELIMILGSSVLLITHDLGVVANFCDTVAIMYAGEIVEYGSIEDIFDRKQIHHPYTEGLFNSIPDIHTRTLRLNTITGLMPDPANLPDGCKFHPRCSRCMKECRSETVGHYRQGSHFILCHLAANGGPV